MSRKKTAVQNEATAIEDVRPIIDEEIVNIVKEIFEAVSSLDILEDIFTDLTERLVTDLKANSILDFNLELSEDQRKQLLSVIKTKGNEACQNYLANINTDGRTKSIYALVREKTTAIADAVLSSIGQEINRGAIINAVTVQANSENPKYDEILLRKTKSAGDITVPTSVVMISTNCVEVIKSSCQEEVKDEENPEGEEAEPETSDNEERTVADKPAKPPRKGRGKK
jgi:hypothetical protein